MLRSTSESNVLVAKDDIKNHFSSAFNRDVSSPPPSAELLASYHTLSDA